MLQVILRFISTMGTIITAGALVWQSNEQLAFLAKIILFGLIALCFVATVADVVNYTRGQPKRFMLNSPEIKNFMVNFLKSGGRAAVFSRDLSWANKGSTAQVLEDKAANGELIIFAGRQTDELQKLIDKGAEIHNYSGSSFVPKARFTIVDYGKAGTRLAIGVPEGDKHVIYEFNSSDQAVMALARDLVELARKTVPKV